MRELRKPMAQEVVELVALQCIREFVKWLSVSCNTVYILVILYKCCKNYSRYNIRINLGLFIII